MPLFKKPIDLNHTVNVNVEIPDLEETAKPVLDRISRMAKTAFVTLAIAIPSVIVFAVVANVVGEVTADRMINGTEEPIE
jgi:hypothetical protein